MIPLVCAPNMQDVSKAPHCLTNYPALLSLPCRLDLDRDGNCTEPSPRIWLGNIAPTATSKNLHAVLGRWAARAAALCGLL